MTKLTKIWCEHWMLIRRTTWRWLGICRGSRWVSWHGRLARYRRTPSWTVLHLHLEMENSHSRKGISGKPHRMSKYFRLGSLITSSHRPNTWRLSFLGLPRSSASTRSWWTKSNYSSSPLITHSPPRRQPPWPLSNACQTNARKEGVSSAVISNRI